MEKLKFRVWDKDNKKFYYFDMTNAHEYVAIFLHTPVQLFTGRYDINGTAIYQGDVVRRYTSTGKRARHAGTLVVRWKETNIYTGFNIGTKSSFEIIGHVFQPEMRRYE